jgi:putative transposase
VAVQSRKKQVSSASGAVYLRLHNDIGAGAPRKACGHICCHGRKINLSHVFAGQNVGVTQVGERIWLVTFMHYDLGYFDDEVGRVEPIENPFGSKVLPMCSE